MRVSTLVATPLLAALIAVPAAAQVSARIHVGAPLVRPARIATRPRGFLSIDAYAPSQFGAWQDYSQYWEPITVYYYDGQYYDYPIVEYATPTYVYRYDGRLFFPPRDRQFVAFRSRTTGFFRGRPDITRGRYADGGAYRQPPRAEYGQRSLAPRAGDRSFAPRAGEYNGRDRGRPAPGHSAMSGTAHRSAGRHGH